MFSHPNQGDDNETPQLLKRYAYNNDEASETRNTKVRKWNKKNLVVLSLLRQSFQTRRVCQKVKMFLWQRLHSALTLTLSRNFKLLLLCLHWTRDGHWCCEISVAAEVGTGHSRVFRNAAVYKNNQKYCEGIKTIRSLKQIITSYYLDTAK